MYVSNHESEHFYPLQQRRAFACVDGEESLDSSSH